MKSTSLALICAASFVTMTQADIIDFSSVDATISVGRVTRIDDVTFSHDLYTHPDGFEWYGSDVVYPYYGERREFMTFDNSVFLQSIDIANFLTTLPVPSSVIFELYDESDVLLNSIITNTTNSLQTVSFNQAGVSKLLIDFTGGEVFYGDGRLHAWYQLDNLTYEHTAPSVPEPSTLVLFGIALVALAGFARRRLLKA